MSKKSKKLTLVFSALIFCIVITISVFAVNNGKKPSVVAGNYENLIADRMSLSLENTEFVLTKATDKTETFTLSLYFSAKKTQGDFFARINNFSFQNLTYDNIVFNALNKNTENKLLNNLVLPAADGEPLELKWRIDLTLSVQEKGEINSVFLLDCTSGVTEQTSMQKLIEIPIKITVK